MRSFAIIPAAGASRRVGQPKLLLPWGQQTVIESVLDAWTGSRVEQVVVVVRPRQPELAAVCQRYQGQPNRVSVVIPPETPSDMKASVRLGLDFVVNHFQPQPEDAWLLAPADMPGLQSALIDRLLQHAAEHQGPIVAPQCHGRRGHPVLFRWYLAERLAGLADNEGVNRLLDLEEVCRLQVEDESILQDIDTLGDYERLKPRRC